MPGAERAIAIRRPRDEVFRFLADGRTAQRWRKGVLDVQKVSGEGVGAVYRQAVRGPAGRRIAADYEVTVFEPDRRIAFRTIAGPVRPEGEFALEAMGDATIVSFSLRAELSGWRRLLLSRPVQSTMDAEMRALDELRTCSKPEVSGRCRWRCPCRSSRRSARSVSSTSPGFSVSLRTPNVRRVVGAAGGLDGVEGVVLAAARADDELDACPAPR